MATCARRLAEQPPQSRSSTVDGTLRFWNLPEGSLRSTLETRNGIVHALALSPDGMVVAAGFGNGAILDER